MRNDVRFGDLVKILWHDGLGFSLYAKRLERGRFLWPSPADGVVAITSAQLGYMGSRHKADSKARLGCKLLDRLTNFA
jgi:transposase